MLGQRLSYNFNYLFSLKKKNRWTVNPHTEEYFPCAGRWGGKAVLGLELDPGGALFLQAPSVQG